MIIKIYLFIVNRKQFRIENEVTLLSSFALISKNPFTNLQIQQFLILINSNFLERDLESFPHIVYDPYVIFFALPKKRIKSRNVKSHWSILLDIYIRI